MKWVFDRVILEVGAFKILLEVKIFVAQIINLIFSVLILIKLRKNKLTLKKQDFSCENFSQFVDYVLFKIINQSLKHSFLNPFQV